MKWIERAVRTELGEGAGNEMLDVPVGAALAEALAYTPTVSTLTPAAPSQTFGLSPREMEVLRLMADGLSNRQVADALYVSLRTVATHVTSVLTKLDLPSRTAAVAFAIRNGLA